MPQIINTNIASLNAQRNLNKSQSANQTALQRLSSGLRINSAKDDAAGLAISTRFNSQIKGLNVAVRNAGDGISLAQTAEGALGSMNDNLQRIRELAVQSANATNSDVDREALQAEVSQLVAEISRTADETDFNGRKLLDGSFKATFQIGANAGQTLDISIAELTAGKLGASKSAGISAVGSDNGLSNGDLIINGEAITPSRAEDDNSSYANNAASAIAKVAAINRAYDATGVKAVANTNVVAGSEMTASALTGTVTINGVTVDVQTTSSASTSRASIVEVLNAVSDQTGVTAVDTGDDANGVNLIAADGRNITISFSTVTAATTGLAAADTYETGYTLIADGDVDKVVISGGDGTGNGDLANAGLSRGSYQVGAAQLASTSTSSTNGVGFQATSLSSTDVFGFSGRSGTTNVAGLASGTSAVSGFGTSAEVISFTANGSTVTLSAVSTDYGADKVAAALNSLTGVSASAETRAVLNLNAAVAAGVLTTSQNIAIYDTATTGTALGTLAIASGQTVAQVANTINTTFTSIVATYDSTNNTINIVDVAGNTLAVTGTGGATAITVAAVTKTGTSISAAITVNSTATYVYGYIKDVDVTDKNITSISVASNMTGTTTSSSTFFTTGSTATGTIDSLSVSVASSTYGMDNGDMILNGVSIKAADTAADTASATKASDNGTIQTSLKEKSAIAIAASINQVSAETGVTATVNETRVVGSDGDTYDANVTAAKLIYGAGDSGKLYINGVDIGVIALADDGSGGIDTDATRQTTIDLINQKSGLTGVVAEDNGESITLVAKDGRNVSVAVDNDNTNNGATSPTATGFGALIGLDASMDGIGEADIGTASATNNNVGVRGNTAEGAAYETTYGTVTLTSAKEITLSAGTSGKDELEGLGFTVGTFGGGENGQFLTEIDISTFEGAQAALTAVDNAIASVASQRANLGAVQNRMDSTVKNLAITSENLSAANSRIQDADFAAETAELSRTQVLQQAGISILAQANQGPQQVLSLLQ
ncbi:MAG: hypothetical protein H7A08_05100 [Oceanospirillaceae bacterium]|nr:hypothetical protein [Oceanospirillaceae bacterium]MCP5350098.1 hypothetical protein [Oceanospirillaceae bacterium]